MKTIIIFLFPLYILAFPFDVENNRITFTDKKQVFPVTGVISSVLEEEFALAVMRHELPYMFIYFDSPGGDVFSMARMIEIMKSRDILFIGIARAAYSAAFIMFESCDVRIMLPSGTLMAHNASGFFAGDLEQINSLLQEVRRVIKIIDKKVAKRMGISYIRYMALIANDLWMDSTRALEMKATDTILNSVICSKEMTERTYLRTVLVCNFMGQCTKKTYEFNECPLITTPIREVTE